MSGSGGCRHSVYKGQTAIECCSWAQLRVTPLVRLSMILMDVDKNIIITAPPAYPPPQPLAVMGFFARPGTRRFEDPTQGGRGYLPQVNEWAQGAIEWRTERAGGSEHVPLWEAHPVCEYIPAL